MNIHKEYSIEIGGKKITAQFTDLADQAHGSVILSSQETVVMATAVMGKDDGNNPGWFNLTVEYLEKFYATGKILGSRFQRREGKPTDQAVLSGRVIDRTLRPLFDHRIKNPVQVVVTVIAVGDADPSILGINAASLALATSNIPWNGPVGAVRIGTRKGSTEPVVDLYLRESDELESGEYGLNLTVCGRAGTINMIEAMAHESDDEELGHALELAVQNITLLENWQNDIVREIGKTKDVVLFPTTPDVLYEFYEEQGREPLWNALTQGIPREELYSLAHAFFVKVQERFTDETEEHQLIRKLYRDFYHHQEDALIHKLGLEENKRADGRAMDQVRPLHAQAGGISPVLHGSGIFYRGETHVLSVLTLAGPDESKIEEGMEIQTKRHFMHHYNFPPYSVGEAGRFGSTGRREIGHGALVEKAFIPVLPDTTIFPYTIRVVSESTASNGSTSQASICATTIALMDGGVPITKPVAGIAMGLLQDEKNPDTYKILTDIQGPEDHHGDMDFKVAGTRDGVTAIQLDIKVAGVPVQALKDALAQGKKARLHILDAIEKEISAPRENISPRAPKILVHKINPDQIGMVIGKGGDTIKGIQEKTGAQLTIEEDGTVYFIGTGDSADQALAAVQAMTKEWSVGEQAQGTVAKILDGVGAIVKISDWKTGMVHISEIANFRVEKIEEVLSEGMSVPVTVISIDKERDRMGLSIKKDNPEFIKQVQA
ncbi:MAG: polyribonucleotide nucleotidyltransferase [Candidatus Pacebacteria bacterium]|nr:polyribonucleotide nucleotidyltransferase [Candidatus Paceibacterota bacterium]